MACLLCKISNINHYLKAYHIVGRLKSSVNTVISDPAISKIHATLEWNGTNWLLTDLSTNGVWLNGKQVARNIAIKLHLSDLISFSADDHHLYQLIDDSSPSDLLISEDHKTAISLDEYNLLPNDDEPEASLFFDIVKGQWKFEHLDHINPEATIIDEGDTIRLSNQQWSLFTNSVLERTAIINPNSTLQSDISAVFNVSSDEEAVQLVLHTPNGVIDLKTRTHHYLLLLLARKKLSDISHGLSTFDQGWVYSDDLCKDLGLEPCHMNIQVHRAKKQIVESTEPLQILDIFERQAGKIRLSLNNIIINKGGEKELLSS